MADLVADVAGVRDGGGDGHNNPSVVSSEVLHSLDPEADPVVGKSDGGPGSMEDSHSDASSVPRDQGQAGASSFRLCVPTESSTISGPINTTTVDSDADVAAADITTAPPPGLDADPLVVRGFDPDIEVAGPKKKDPGSLGPIWTAQLADLTRVIVFGLTPRDGFDRDTLREQVTERLRELAGIVHPNLGFPLGMVETPDGVGLVFRGNRFGFKQPSAALNACVFLRHAGVACCASGDSYFVLSGTTNGAIIIVCCWGLIGSVDALAVDPSDPHMAPELVGDDGRAIPTDATEVYALAARCARWFYKSADPEGWKSRTNDVHIRPFLEACLSPAPNDRPDLDTALLWMMAEAEHEKEGWTAAHMACQRDRIDFLRSYLDGGGDVEATTIDGSVSLLGVACKYGSLACVDLLLDRGADPVTGRALHWAACGGQAIVIGRLVTSGVTVQIDDFAGVRNLAGFGALLGRFVGNVDNVATAYMFHSDWDPACLALLIRRGAIIVLLECASAQTRAKVEKASTLAAPGAHPPDDCNQPQPGGVTVLSACHRHRTRLSDDGRSIIISLSDEDEEGVAGSEVTTRLPSWVHVYLSADLVGRVVIGRDAFGTVTRRALYGTTPVAVKVVNLPGTQRGMQSFVWEVFSRVMASAHPRTVSLMGLVYDEADGTFGLVCELMDQDLAAWLRKSRSVRDRASVLRDAADGLAYIHGKGLVHRDIKPANIYVRGSAVKIGNFGLPSVVSGRKGWTRRAYAAPEVLAGCDDVSTAASDAYSFGLVVYEVLTGVGTMPTAEDREGKEGAPPWMVKNGLPVPREGWWAKVLRQALSPHPDERPRVGDWEAVLGAIRETETVNCSRFLGVCATESWEEAMGCAKGVDTGGDNRCDDGRNARHFVAGSEDVHLVMVAKCVELGCNLNEFSTHWRMMGPPLACVRTAEMAAELVAHGADVNAANEDMVTVLMCAANNGRGVAVRFLLDAGADPLAVDSQGRTAVDWAFELRVYSRTGREDVVMLLLEAGAVPGDRKTVLKEARREGHDRVVAWLEAASNGENSSLL